MLDQRHERDPNRWVLDQRDERDQYSWVLDLGYIHGLKPEFGWGLKFNYTIFLSLKLVERGLSKKVAKR